ncbi:MAG: shikimate dehydrogenase family protein, partial [Candidatus Binatia bacterium]
MARTDDIALLQSCINNRLDRTAIAKKRVVGIVGDSPSRYAKSPPIWNAVFHALKMDAVYLPFDVDESRLPDLVRALKESDRFLGANVTVPYKIKIMKYLDELDEKARQIQAVNTIARGEDGRLSGYNTDGSGFLESILTAQPGEDRPFVASPKGINVLLIGAGGSGRAVAFTMAEALQKGRLWICNRTADSARALTQEINRRHANASAVEESDIGEWAPKADLIINCTTKGQGGIRRSSNGQVTVLEPYSALAPADPAIFSESDYGKPEFYRDWLRASLSDIEANNQESWQVALSVPLTAGFC